MSDLRVGLMHRMNPVLEREVQERMRSRRAPLMLFFFVGILTAIAWLVFQISLGNKTGSSVDPTELSRMGKAMFEYVLFFMLLLVLFLVPGLASGAIAGERERQTLIPMQLTLLRPRRIVLGKIVASCAFLTFLLIAAAPLLTLSYVIGGVGVGQVVGGLAAVIFVGFVIASISVMCSTITKKVQVATVLSFFLVIVLLAGPPIAGAMVAALSRGEVTPPKAIMAPNPVTLVAAAAGGNVDANRFRNVVGPMSGLKATVIELDRTNQQRANDIGFGAGPVVLEPPDDLKGFLVLSYAVQAAMALGAVVIASRRLKTPAATER